jgi:hypothetical protein
MVVHPEAVHRDTARGALLGVEVVEPIRNVPPGIQTMPLPEGLPGAASGRGIDAPALTGSPVF